MSQFWAIYKKVDFVQLLRPLLLRFAIFRGKKAFIQKYDNIVLNVLWYSIYMQKNINKDVWNVSKLRPCSFGTFEKKKLKKNSKVENQNISYGRAS